MSKNNSNKKETDEIIEPGWEAEEWYKMKKKLAKLSLEELRDLTTKVGIVFADGNEIITNKEDFILVLDEADKDEMITEYKRIVKSRRKS